MAQERPTSAGLLRSASLPVRQHKDRIVGKVHFNRVTLIIANTGSGKSSQVPQMLLEEGLMPLLCTQPRRLAVVAISKLVAQERGCMLGEEVGYHIGHRKVMSSRSKLVFETAGVLLEELRCEGVRVLSRYKVIILDEIHERSIESDLTLTCIKQFMLKNSSLRLVLMSATFDCDMYKDYFKDVDRGERVEIVPVLFTPLSQNFNCEVFYLEEVLVLLGRERFGLDCNFVSPSEKINDLETEVQHLLADLITYLHKNDGDLAKNILVFLPTYKALEQQWSILKRKNLDIRIFVLHSSIDMDRSIQAIDVSLPARKVILATNVAESSVTIQGISYVVDSCCSLEIFWDNERKKCMPRLVWVSKSQADQRKGRTGRTCDGQVFRMVPRSTYNQFAAFEKPAVQLLSLREQVLAIACAESKAINDPKFLFSKAITPPNALTVQDALVTLRGIGALNTSSQRGRYWPTDFGRLIASFPISLASAMLVVKGGQMGLIREAAVLAALLDSSPFPIVHPFGHDIQYQTYLGRYYQQGGSLDNEMNIFSYISVILANMHAFEFWQCTFKDKQRLERLLKYANHSSDCDFDATLVEGEDIWCAQHSLSPCSLHAIEEISSTIMEKLHIYRPTFLCKLQGPPSYYSAYDFEHTCEICPDEENIMGEIILQEDEFEVGSGFCMKDKYVEYQQFHSQEDINNLKMLIGQVQNLLQRSALDSQIEEGNSDDDDDDDESYTTTGTLCRYFQRGVCRKGTCCEYSHDLTAKRSLCNYFMTAMGCRYGELCEFRHAGTKQFIPAEELFIEFEDGSCSEEQYIQLLPRSDQDHILVYDEDDFSFTERLCKHYKPDNIIVIVGSCGYKPYLRERVQLLSSMGVKIQWGISINSLFQEDPSIIPWTLIACVLWNIRREKVDEVITNQQMLHFFCTLSLFLLTRDIADINILLTMYTDQYATCQVERAARDCFFFLTQSIPFDSTTFGVYKQTKNTGLSIGEEKPVTYVFELLPPSASQHGNYFWHLHQAVEEPTAQELGSSTNSVFDDRENYLESHVTEEVQEQIFQLKSLQIS